MTSERGSGKRKASLEGNLKIKTMNGALHEHAVGDRHPPSHPPAISSPKNEDETDEERSAWLPLNGDYPNRNAFPCTNSKTASFFSPAWNKEVRLLLELAIPTLLLTLGNFVPMVVTASYIGRVYGAVYLDGFQLASLTANLFSLSILTGLYSAADTLGPQAIGAGNLKEAGLVAMRGFLGSMIVVIPICAGLAVYMQDILLWLHQDVEASLYASQWYLVFIAFVPFYALYMVTWKFLSAQHVMMPLLIGTGVSVTLVLPLAMQYCTRWMGFLGSALALVLFNMAQAFVTLGDLYIFQRHIPETWPGLSAWREALQWEPLLAYFSLGMGGIVAMSEWIYWEAMTLAIGTLGVVPLSVHAITIQVVTTMFMGPMSLAIALSIRIASTLPQNVEHAKQLAIGTMIAGTLLFGTLAWVLYLVQEFVFHIFTSEEDVLAQCRAIWWHVCHYFLHLSVYVLFRGIATGLGMQWTLGLVTFVALWFFGLPTAYFFGIYQAGTLEATWFWYAPPYIAMNVVLLSIFVTTDWHKISQQVREREGMDDDDDKPLVHASNGPTIMGTAFDHAENGTMDSTLANEQTSLLG